VIDCGVNLELFRPVDQKDARKKIGFQTEDKILLYVGRVDPMKGVDRLLAATTLLKDQVQFKLLIIGGDDPPGREQERLQDMAQRLGIGESVIFAGSLPQEELPFYYSAADVFALPSHYESFGMVGLESLACGTPVVATDVGVYPEILNGGLTGRLASGNSPDSIAEKISEVLSLSKNGESLPREIRKAVERFTWSAVADALIAEYTRLIELSGRDALATASGLESSARVACSW
jgi:D-inositol-3-phosphate glycosyltransferase